MLETLAGPRREEVIQGWRELLSEELSDSYPSSNIVWVTKSWI
jgi:hypothetical protein